MAIPGISITEDSGSSSPSLHAPVVDIYHEIGSDNADSIVEHIHTIDTAQPPTRIIFRSHLVATPTQTFSSTEYLATTRRRAAKQICNLISQLALHESDSNFAVWSHGVLEKLRKSIDAIEKWDHRREYEVEANSCEIMRQVRDTLLGTGWLRYKERSVRSAVIGVLEKLATVEEVIPADVDAAFAALLAINLDPCVGSSLTVEHENAEGEVSN